MDVFITYDRYEHNEWYSIYNIDTDFEKAFTHCLNDDLVNFISYGPDDCHCFVFEKVVMTKKQYKELCRLDKEGSEAEITKFMIPIFEGDNFEKETFLFTDGCSDICEVIDLYCQQCGIDADDDEAIEEATARLFNDDELFLSVLKEYIRITY